MSSDEETAMIRETVAKFVDRELLPLEPHYLKSKLPGSDHPELTAEQWQRLRTVSKDLGLWGLDAPEDLGGHDLPTCTMAAVHEELGRTCVPFVLPPDSPNLRMLQAVGTDAQKREYMKPYIEGRMSSAIAISEPGAGGDPAAMKTRAVLEGGQWVLNGRKIWISNARAADFIIVMARVGTDARQGGITAFIVEKGTPGFIIEREIPMLGGGSTYEIVFEDCRIPEGSVLGEVGKGYAPMQLRLRTRRLEMGSTCIGIREGRGAFRRALRGRDIAVNLGSPPLPQPDLQQFKRADDPGQEIVEVVGDAARELADRLHLLRLAQRLFGLLALGDRLGNAGLQRLVEVLQRLLGALACRDVLKQHRDLAAAGGLYAECREFEVAPGGDQLTLEAYGHSRPKHAAVEFGPAIGFIRHHLTQPLPDDVGDTGVLRVGRVGLDMDVVAERAVRAVEEFDDAKAFIDGVEQGAVSLFAVGKRDLGAFQLGIFGDRESAEAFVLRLERRDALLQFFDLN